MTTPTRFPALASALAVSLLAAPLLVACAPSAPAIVDITPLKGQRDVPGDTPIRVTFDREMDHGSVESRFNITPAIPGCATGGCPVVWSDRSLIVDHAGHGLATDTHYRVRLLPGYRDRAGHENDTEHSWEFFTEPAPALRASSPADGSTGVAVDSDVGLQFSRAVVLPKAAQVAFDPPLAFRLALDPADASRVVVSPLRPLDAATTYRVTVGAGLEDVHQNHLPKAVTIGFKTGSLVLGRGVAFGVLGRDGKTVSRIAVLRPPASLAAAAPSLRVVYADTGAIADWAWGFDGSYLWVLHADTGRLVRVGIDGTAGRAVDAHASLIATSPARDEVAYVGPGGSLHVLSARADVAIRLPGAAIGRPAWAGDGERLAVVTTTGAGRGAVSVVDRETLAVATLSSVEVDTTVAAPLAWSFDGGALAFSRLVSDRPEVWTYRPLATAGSLQRVDGLTARALAWASDGSALYAEGELQPAAASAPAGPSVQSGLFRANGRPVAGQPTGFSQLRPIAAAELRADALATPSYDRRVAFIQDAAGRPQLFIMNADGTAPTQVTFQTYDAAEELPAYGVTLPQWSPAV